MTVHRTENKELTRRKPREGEKPPLVRVEARGEGERGKYTEGEPNQTWGAIHKTKESESAVICFKMPGEKERGRTLRTTKVWGIPTEGGERKKAKTVRKKAG